MSTVTLKGMTWSHPRGYDPMVACSDDWLQKTGVVVEWDKRSLQDFESFPVEELARRYDLIVIDHPHVGQITAENCLAPLDVPGCEAAFAALAEGSVGASFPSYYWQGHQWAFPIDAATQVLAFRPDRLGTAPTAWADVVDLARGGEVLLPLRPPHSLMCLFSLCGNFGRPCSVERDRPFVDAEIGVQAIEMIRELAALTDPACTGMDPIAVLDRMGEEGSRYSLAPLIYGYVSYSLEGFRANRIAFADMPVAGANGPVGSALGGTGIAVSVFSANRDAAVDFAYWIAGGAVQANRYWRSGGQPGHAAGWEDDAANAATLGFYRNTRRTLEGAWLRPRHDGYMPFQEAASQRINRAVTGREPAAKVIGDLNDLFVSSFR
ncbi:ABC transporter substrate-binding protein [Sinorhizobium sp. RAC02]|uniref:extracellular solute-binding protein n=1 Tax=Sinorhizobium sp. RAC02 TaxID=1842534 RepID=UPI00083CBFD0|nr:ABC transporter substrate-binding protein [Sinorhizobium sp. RAC02]AOF94204.1 bacterial extracellular solute-binding family protein [Sinorhizobium sp. RAC02]